ncbi:winged helix-turn-helix domain-containing protein [Halostagnicola sp. A-GB9-2]|uniref:ArsR/SmtB family transcription factor n=1 Tax=Halostagnicola sp. A-GB9-2 TaxID=3048066 RepID=UPI0024BFE694|nr:winged helix-turn-helix domain-containing protein [Halostagnicola sp. A-GB9-2]MDJ1432449.1 winged helix-turn-helix domain-containing protein [Halostagnicola sp. A-GB9-2]
MQRTSCRGDPTATQPIDLTETIELLADDHAREILQSLDETKRSAAEVVDRCDISRVTAYRRLNRLEDAGLVTAEIRPVADGNHCTVYANALDTLTLSVCADGFEGAVETARGPPTGRSNGAIAGDD